MNKTIKKILVWTLSLIVVGFIGYSAFLAYAVYSFSSSCGLNDGPFEASMIPPIQITDSAQQFELSDNGKLILENRNDTLSPILTLIENDKVIWTLDINTRNTEGYESTHIWEISDVTMIKNTELIKLNFVAHWIYGIEGGSIEIDRESGENSFCLSW